MYKIDKIILWVLILYLPLSCDNVREKDLVSEQITSVKPLKETKQLHPTKDTIARGDFPNAIIVDSLIISIIHTTEATINVSSLLSGESLGQFCPLGRSLHEPLSIFPEIDFTVLHGELYGLLLSSIDSRAYVWNVTKSIKEGQTIYEKILPLDNPDKGILPVMAGFWLDQGHFVIYNTRQNARFHIQPQEYEIYNVDSGRIIQAFSPFKPVNFKDGAYSSDTYYKASHTINPSKTNIANAMLYAPIINIVDVNTGKSHSYRLSKYPKFTDKERYYHFLSVCSDDNYIFALYLGCVPEDFADTSSVLFQFDWEGKIVKQYDLGMPFSKIQLNNGNLYLTSYLNSDIYSVNLKTAL